MKKYFFALCAALVSEMEQRGYNHHSPLEKKLATGRAVQDIFIDPPARQLKLLAAKNCGCR